MAAPVITAALLRECEEGLGSVDETDVPLADVVVLL